MYQMKKASLYKESNTCNGTEGEKNKRNKNRSKFRKQFVADAYRI